MTRQKLLNRINVEFDGSYYVGNKIITADKKYQILIRNDEELTAEISKYDGEDLKPGELSMDLIGNQNTGTIDVYVSIGGIKSYKEYCKEKLKDKTEDEKIQMILDAFEFDTKEELFETYEVSSIEEFCQSCRVDSIDDLLISAYLVDGYDYDENTAMVNISGGSGINKTINLAESTVLSDFIVENKTYKYTATSGKNSVQKEITISWVDDSVDDENIFIFDSTTGYIVGVKDEYITRNPTQTYGIVDPKYITKGAPILHIPDKIDGQVVKGIDERAFFYVINISKLILPNTIEVIDKDAFEFCENLKYVEFPSSVTTLKDGAFWQTAIEKIYIPSTIKTIEGNMFYADEEGPTVTIDCEVQQKPSTWSSYWIRNENINKYIINWGVSK